MSNFLSLKHYTCVNILFTFTTGGNTMKQRLDAYTIGYKAISPFFRFTPHLAASPVGKNLLDLIAFRVSQINGCAYCLDMHSKDLRADGETEQRLYLMSNWRETDFFTERERAALAWTEAVNAYDVPDDVYKEALKHFSETELIDLTMAGIATTCYNKLNIAFRMPAGSYTVGQHTNVGQDAVDAL